MTGNQQFNIGKKNPFQIDFGKLKSGIKAEEFKDNAAMLEIFNASDSNKNSVLEDNEVSVFVDKLTQAAGEDKTLSESETNALIRQEQETQRKAGQQDSKTKLKAKDVFDFLNKWQDLSANSTVKSSTVQGEQRVVAYEDGAQEVINKDGSKVITTISGGIKSVKSFGSNGKLEKEERVDDEKGIIETLIYGDDDNVSSRVVTDKENGRILKQIESEGTEEEQVVEYQYTDDDNYTKTATYKNTKTVITVEDGKAVSSVATQYKNGNPVQEISYDESGALTQVVYNGDKKAYEETISENSSSVTVYNQETGRKAVSQLTVGDEVYVATYDGKGNTQVVVQNNESVSQICQKFGITVGELAAANKGVIHKNSNGQYYFTAGQEIKIPGELPPDHAGLVGRKSSDEAKQQYAQAENQRIADSFGGKSSKTVTAERDYKNWEEFAKDLLVSEGVKNPTKEQINDKKNELLILNRGKSVPKSGEDVTAIQTPEESVVSTMESKSKAAQESFDYQMDKDGWAADVADGVAHIWNNDLWTTTGNTAAKVRESLSEYNSQIEELRAAQQDGTFAAKFKEVFGVEYSQEKVENYNNKRAKYVEVASVAASLRALNACESEIKVGIERDVARRYAPGATEGAMHYPDGQAFNPSGETEEYNPVTPKRRALEELLGLQAGKLDEVDDSEVESMFAEIKSKVEAQLEQVLDGKTIEQYQAEMLGAYEDAYGTENDIMARVEEYNMSQDAGGAAVKSVAKIAGAIVVTVLSAGTASPTLVAALGAAGVSFAVDASDMMSNNVENTTEEYLLAARDAAIDGASQYFGGQATELIRAANFSRPVRYALTTLAETGFDAGAEYLKTGEVTLQNVLMSAGGSLLGQGLGDLIEYRQTKRATAAAAKADMDPLNDVPSNWSQMTAEERRANLLDRQARHQQWLESHPEAGLSEAERVGRVNPEHSRYEYTISSEQLGGGTRINVDGVDVTVDVPAAMRTDINYAQRQVIQNDVAKLKTKGMTQEFTDGLETLEAFQTTSVAYSSRVDGSYDLRATTADNAKPFGTFASNERVKAMGLDGDVGLVQDAANLSGMAYSDADALSKSGWTQIQTSSADNGFHAKAFQKDGKIMIAFRGSDDAADLTSDFQMLAGRVPEQFENAKDFVAQIKEMYPDAQIIVTGHSLGGALTEMVASEYDDVLGLTFDAVGTRSIAAANGLADNHNTINYVVKGDVISNANEHVGTVTVVNEVVTRGTEPNSPHAITNFMGKDNNSLLCVESGLVERQLSAADQARAGLAQRGLTMETLTASAVDGQITISDADFKAVKTQFEYDIKNANADLSAFQAQVDMVANPEQRAQLQSVLDTRKTQITTGADIAANSHATRAMTGDEINEFLSQPPYNISEAAFGDTPGERITFDKQTKMVRVFNDESSFGKGNWLMAYDDVAGLTPEQIKEKFALPAAPKYVVEIEVPAGCEMVTGSCKAVQGWGEGGGTQYFITGGNRPKLYGQVRRLPQ